MRLKRQQPNSHKFLSSSVALQRTDWKLFCHLLGFMCATVYLTVCPSLWDILCSIKVMTSSPSYSSTTWAFWTKMEGDCKWLSRTLDFIPAVTQVVENKSHIWPILLIAQHRTVHREEDQWYFTERISSRWCLNSVALIESCRKGGFSERLLHWERAVSEVWFE